MPILPVISSSSAMQQVTHLANGQGAAVDGHEALRKNVLHDSRTRIHLQLHPHVLVRRAELSQRRGGVHVARHVVAADLVAESRGALKVECGTGAHAREVGPSERLVYHIEGELVALDARDGEARPIKRNARADRDALGGSFREGDLRDE